MKILCLHGYGQHSDSIKSTFSGIERILHRLYKAELHFVMGPHQVTNFKNEMGCAWFTCSSNELKDFFETNKYIGIQDSIDKLTNYIRENGPFDGIIGFSQGSVMATILLCEREFKFSFIIGGYPPSDLKFNLEKINTPSLHIWGLQDSIVSPDKSEKNYELYPGNKEKYIHSGKHIIPCNSESKKVYKDFIDMYIDYGQGKILI